MSLSEHVFGGHSTDLKLSVVEGYLRAFTTALRNHHRLIYIDAYAGTGERTRHIEARDPNLFGDGTDAAVERRRGSARIAIDTTPRFEKLVFIEKNTRHFKALENLQAENPHRQIELRQGLAEKELGLVLKGNDWRKVRGVLFLDPYGMDVSWETLKAIRKTEALDVWYYLSLAGLYRQSSRDAAKLTPEKESAIDRMVGTNAWRQDWYRRENAAQTSLFEMGPDREFREADVNTIESWMQKRLGELFPKVLKPLRLYNDRGAPMASLFFIVSNPDPKAVALASRVAVHILKSGSSSQKRPR